MISHRCANVFKRDGLRRERRQYAVVRTYPRHSTDRSRWQKFPNGTLFVVSSSNNAVVLEMINCVGKSFIPRYMVISIPAGFRAFSLAAVLHRCPHIIDDTWYLSRRTCGEHLVMEDVVSVVSDNLQALIYEQGGMYRATRFLTLIVLSLNTVGRRRVTCPYCKHKIRYW